MKKFVLTSGLVCAGVGALLTLIVLTALASRPFPFSTQFGIVVMVPTIKLGRALGLHDGASPWLWNSLAVAVSTLLCFSVGVLAGLFVYALNRHPSKKDEISG